VNKLIKQQQQRKADVCIAVITGFSDVPRKGLVVRLLKQIVEQLEELRINDRWHSCGLELDPDLERVLPGSVQGRVDRCCCPIGKGQGRDGVL
jgi:hypothetical protein